MDQLVQMMGRLDRPGQTSEQLCRAILYMSLGRRRFMHEYLDSGLRYVRKRLCSGTALDQLRKRTHEEAATWYEAAFPTYTMWHFSALFRKWRTSRSMPHSGACTSSPSLASSFWPLQAQRRTTSRHGHCQPVPFPRCLTLPGCRTTQEVSERYEQLLEAEQDKPKAMASLDNSAAPEQQAADVVV